jgi:hypothetical protein
MRFHPLRKFAQSLLLLVGLLASPASAQWQQTSGAANDIGIGANGAVWVIGTNRAPGGFGIWQRAPRGNDWSAIDGAAVRIAVDPSGMPWVVNDAGNIFRRTAAGWQQLPGAAKDIGIGANGAVWVIGTNAVPGGFGIWTWTGTTWTAIDGGGVRIAVDPTGAPWVVNNAGGIFRRVGNQWQQTSGAANDIGIGANGTVVVIGTNAVNGGFGIWALNAAGNWDAIPGGATNVAVGPNGLPWVVNSSYGIFEGVGRAPAPVVGGVVVTTPTTGGNLLTNGGFEAPALGNGAWNVFPTIPGWRTASGPGVEVQAGAAGAPAEGRQLAELDSNAPSAIAQDVATNPRQRYEIRLSFAARGGTARGTNRLAIVWEGQVIARVDADGTGSDQPRWVTVSYFVTARGRQATLELRDEGAADSLGTYIDNVSVTPAP